jgi:hypothetical protein
MACTGHLMDPNAAISTRRASVGSKKRVGEQDKYQARATVVLRIRIFSRSKSQRRPEKSQKNGSFSLIERVILSAGAMLIFSVSFQIDQMPEGEEKVKSGVYIPEIGR